ncbi:PAS domain S-box protein [Candidatus Hydrogenedentota bacterium]
MTERKRVACLILIMVVVCASAVTISIALLYDHQIEENLRRLQVTAQSQARLIESVGRYDARVAKDISSKHPDYNPSEATLGQIADAHERYRGFGETGEFTLARLEGDSIVFLLRHRHDNVEQPKPVPFDSTLAEPMRKALKGLSGTVIALDYRGKIVLAAHEPVGVLDLGIVAKIDRSEIRAPFLKAGLVAGFGAFLIVLVGTALFIRTSNPIIARLEAHTRDLEEEVEERKRAEEAIQRERAFTEAALDAQQDTFFVFDPETGKAIRWNSAFEKLSGYSGEEIASLKAPDTYYDEDDLTRAALAVEQVLGEGSATVELSLICKDARRIPTEYSVSTIEGLEGTGTLLVSVGRDITERKKAEEERLKSEERLRLILEYASDGINIAAFDTKTEKRRLVLCNDRYTEMAGRSREELMAADDLNELEQKISKREDCVDNFVRGAPMKGVSSWIRPDGKDNYHEWTAVPVTVDDAIYIIGLDRDITERIRSEEERVSLEAQVQHMQKLESLGVLAGGIAHDFNNLLMVVIGNASLALTEMSPVSPMRSKIEDIKTAGQRAADLSRQMLAYSGKGNFVVDSVDLGELVREMSHLLESSVSRNSTLEYDLAPNLLAARVDEGQIRQSVMNLIINASEAIGEGPGIISVSSGVMECDRGYFKETYLDENQAEGPYVYLKVADTGCGMDEETKVGLFDPFFTTKFIGRGLGLSAVLGIVRGHRGAIKVDSELGEGSTFTLLFPACEEPVKHRKTRTKKKSDWRGSGTILLVDDEEMLRTIGSFTLERLGFTVLTACDGQEALNVYREHTADIVCVLLDLTMPRMGGEETFHELCRLNDDVCVIMNSGYNEQEMEERFTERAPDGFLHKPYRSEELRNKLQMVLG